MMNAGESRCWSVAPDGVTECERDHAHGGTHQRGGVYWETGRTLHGPLAEMPDEDFSDHPDYTGAA